MPETATKTEPISIRDLATELDAPVIDISRWASALISKLGAANQVFATVKDRNGACILTPAAANAIRDQHPANQP